MNDALQNYNGSIKTNGWIITYLKFADDIDGLAGSEDKWVYLANNISIAASRYFTWK